MEPVNIAVVRGTVSSEPRRRDLPSGGVVTNVELTTEVDGGRLSVPVVVHDREVGVGTGADVVAVGQIRRRFFRAGGVTQSRTELVATRLLRASQRRRVASEIDRVVELLTRAAG